MASKVLLAESDCAIQQTLAGALSANHIDVVCAEDGNAAMCLLNETTPDLLIAEIALPEKNGYELCRYVREEPEFQSLPVILLDHRFDAFNQGLASGVGASLYLSKPFEADELAEIVRRLAQADQDAIDAGPPSDVLAQQYLSPQNRGLMMPEAAGCEMPHVAYLSEATPAGRRKDKYLVLCAALIAATLTVAALAIRDRNSRIGAPTIVQPSAGQTHTTAASVMENHNVEKAKPEDESDSPGALITPAPKQPAIKRGAEPARPVRPARSDGQVDDEDVESLTGEDSHPATYDQPQVSITQARHEKSVGDHLKESGQDMKKAGEQVGVGAKRIVKKGGEAAAWTGKKVKRGFKALKKIF
jgi:CheY-like chemotaxis protein